MVWQWLTFLGATQNSIAKRFKLNNFQNNGIVRVRLTTQVASITISSHHAFKHAAAILCYIQRKNED